jgi:hypothetical protein
MKDITPYPAFCVLQKPIDLPLEVRVLGHSKCPFRFPFSRDFRPDLWLSVGMLDNLDKHHFVGERDSELSTRVVVAERRRKHFAAQVQRPNVGELNPDDYFDFAIHDERGIDRSKKRIASDYFAAIETKLGAFPAARRI